MLEKIEDLDLMDKIKNIEIILTYQDRKEIFDILYDFRKVYGKLLVLFSDLELREAKELRKNE